MYFEDLTPCHYHPGVCDASNWAVPLLSIDWLEHPHRYTIGDVPEAFLHRLKTIAAGARTRLYSGCSFRGLQNCSLCPLNEFDRHPLIKDSDVVIFIPGDHVVYAASGGVDHYVETHGYLPPQGFIDAVIRCPDYGSAEFEEALRLSNADIPSPLVKPTEQMETYAREMKEYYCQMMAKADAESARRSRLPPPATS